MKLPYSCLDMYFCNRQGKVDTHDLSEDSKSFINECLSFNEFCSLSEEDQYSGIRELLEHLLIIDPSKRWDAQTALRESRFIQQHATISTATTTTTTTTTSTS